MPLRGLPRAALACLLCVVEWWGLEYQVACPLLSKLTGPRSQDLACPGAQERGQPAEGVVVGGGLISVDMANPIVFGA
jgi:hypothetical protein